MHSERTVGFEMTNRENLLANFSADGALLTMQHGAEYENIFACWDWRRIPGTTAYDDGAPIKCSDDADEKRNRSRWVGGLAADGLLCTTMELRRDSLRAVKSNFLFEEIVVAVGAGIRNDAPPRELFTTLEQNRLRGEVVAGTSGGRLSIPEERPTGRSFRPGEVQWIHHDGRGYLLLDEQEVRLSTAMQHGKWDPIDPFYRDRADSARIFKCWVEHRCDTAGSYAYAILPCRNAKQTARTAAKRPVELLRNDDACQAVKYGRTVCAVFRRPGSVGAGGLTLRVDAPAVVAIDLRTKRIAASSPCASALNVSLSDGKRRRTASLSLPDGDAMQGTTVCGRLK